MNRSRLVLFLAMTVVVVGVAAGLGALWMSSAQAAVGPLAGEALILPKDARFVMGFDVKRFAASPFYERFATKRGMKPEMLAQLEERTGLQPVRDIDQIVIAGSGRSGRTRPGWPWHSAGSTCTGSAERSRRTARPRARVTRA